jgi:hypothetical protein
MRAYVAEEDSVTIGPRAHRSYGACRPAGPRCIFDDDLLSQDAGHMFGDKAGRNIGAPPGRERNDHCHGPSRVGLPIRKMGHARHGNRGAREAQELAANKRHGLLPAIGTDGGGSVGAENQQTSPADGILAAASTMGLRQVPLAANAPRYII